MCTWNDDTPGDGPGRGADLRREVRHGRQVVAEHGADVGEAIAGELHAVAGVAGEADDDVFEDARARRDVVVSAVTRPSLSLCGLVAVARRCAVAPVPESARTSRSGTDRPAPHPVSGCVGHSPARVERGHRPAQRGVDPATVACTPDRARPRRRPATRRRPAAGRSAGATARRRSRRPRRDSCDHAGGSQTVTGTEVARSFVGRGRAAAPRASPGGCPTRAPGPPARRRARPADHAQVDAVRRQLPWLPLSDLEAGCEST